VTFADTPRPGPLPGGYRPSPPPGGFRPAAAPQRYAEGPAPAAQRYAEGPAPTPQAYAEASAPAVPGPGGDGRIVEQTGHPAVDEVLRSLANAARLAPAEQIAEYEAAHQVLRETLAGIDR
jgi:hypothetical protein